MMRFSKKLDMKTFRIHILAEEDLKANGNMIEDPEDLINESQLY